MRAVPVGRARELAVLDRAVAAALGGSGSVVLVGGEPGIGKTTLVSEGRRRAAARGLRTGWGGCPVTGASPYLPWRKALQDLCPPAATILTSMTGGAQDARFRLFENVVAELEAQARSAPLLLVLDDLHWADAASLELLRFLMRSLRGFGVLVLGTYRDAEVAPGSPLAAVVEDLAGAGSALRLTGLGPGEVEALAAARGAAPEAVALLHPRTGGNPFLVEQLCTMDDPRAAPPAVEALLQRRLRTLSDPCREVLSVAALVGREIDLPVIAGVLDASAEELLACLDAAVAEQVLSPGPPVGFVHDLMREAVAAAVPRARRAQLHTRCGRLLAARPERLHEAARHLQSGLPVGDLDRAVQVSIAAADQALTALAFEQAVEHLTWVVEQLGAAAGSDLLLRLGDAQLKAGDWQGAAVTFRGAADVARAAVTGRRSRVPRSVSARGSPASRCA